MIILAKDKIKEERKIINAPSGLFKFINKSCVCLVDLRHDDYGNPEYVLNIKTCDNEIPFRHDFKDGIQLVNNHGNTQHSPTHDIPYTKDCVEIYNTLGIKSDVPELKKDEIADKRYADRLEKYFNKYGFLFQEKSIFFDEFRAKSFGPMFDRILLLMALKKAVYGNEVDYNRIFNLTFMLALKKLYPLKNYKETELYTEGYEHPFYKEFKSIDFRKEGRSARVKEIELKEYVDEETIDKYLYKPETDYGVTYSMSGDEQEKPEHFYETYVIKDYFLGNEEKFLLRVSDYENVLSEQECYDSGSVEEKHSFNTEKRIKYLFVHGEYSEREDKLFYDFLFHLHFQVCEITSINAEATYPVKLKNNTDLNRNEKFNDKFKAVLRELAEITIKNELDHMTSLIRPSYDIKSKTMGWHIPDLYTAIYYSISLTYGQNTVYRVCADPYCRGNFPISVSNDRRIYCSAECQQRGAQRIMRAAEKRKEAEEKVAFIKIETDDL